MVFNVITGADVLGTVSLGQWAFFFGVLVFGLILNKYR